MKFRFKVAGIHLLCSGLVALCGLYLVFNVWHPDPLQKAVGVTRIFLIMLGIDVVLGPLLTLIVASSKEKKTLKFDLLVILIIQFSAYLYGMYSIAISRPVYLAFDKVRFEIVQADTVSRDSAKVVLPEYRNNPWFSPQWLAVRPYKDVAEQNERTFLELQEGISPAMQADLYQPIDGGTWREIKKTQHTLDELEKYNDTQQVKQILATHPEADSYQPLKAPAVDMAVLLDSKQEKIIAIVDLRPW
jgi:putative fimbrial protein